MFRCIYIGKFFSFLYSNRHHRYFMTFFAYFWSHTYTLHMPHEKNVMIYCLFLLSHQIDCKQLTSCARASHYSSVLFCLLFLPCFQFSRFNFSQKLSFNWKSKYKNVCRLVEKTRKNKYRKDRMHRANVVNGNVKRRKKNIREWGK